MTLAEMMQKFAAPAEQAAPAPAVQQEPAVAGHNKLASEGEKNMRSLFDIYNAMSGLDQEKNAAANVPAQQAATPNEPTPEDVNFAEMAEKIASAEAAEQVDGEQVDFVKVAAEYDAAGRIMARGFYDEFMKLAGNMNTSAPDNQMTESESAAKTPSLGERGLPTLETNFAGNHDHDQTPKLTGPEPKNVYKDSLKPAKTISAGHTGDDPEGAATSLGGGAPVGFATVRDLHV